MLPPKKMEDDAVETVQQPEPRKRAPRKKPDLSGVEPQQITIKTKAGEKTFSARSRKQVASEAPPPPPALERSSNPWTGVLNSWLD